MNIKQKLLNFKPVAKTIEVSKRIVLPGFDGVPLYNVAGFFFQGIYKGSISARASSISYSFFLALFPMIIVFFTLIPFVPIDNFQTILLNFIKNVTPDSTEVVIESTIVDIVERPRGGLLSLTFILALVFATNGFDAMIESFNNTFHTIESRSWIKQKLISTLLFVIISLILIIAIALLTTGTFVFKLLVQKGILQSALSVYVLEAIKWLILITMTFFSISFIYYLAPARESKFRFISAGSTLATILALIASLGFNYYVQNFSRYNALYGSIGTLVILLIWIHFNSMILLIGFELNASIQQASKEGTQELPLAT
jgi:membrane protein